jgi:VanZ family protein
MGRFGLKGIAERFVRFLFFQGPALGYAAVIFLMSSLPGSEVPPLNFPFGDKFVHCLEFGLFGILLFRAFRFPNSHPNPYRMTLAFGILYAASDEIHQMFVPGRFCTVGDFLADSIGLALFAAISMKIHARRDAGKNTGEPVSQP